MSLTPPVKREILTVSELTRRIKSCLEEHIAYVWVSGEVSNLRTPSSGHTYFSLKDQYTQIRCVLFARTARDIKFRIENGIELVLFGRVTVYERQGEYQIIVDKLEPKGIGALQLAFEQLQAKLKGEGLFDPARKKPIPFLPRRIGIITSPTGAAIKDMLNIILRRFPQIEIIIYPVKVQGEGAREEIATALKEFNTLSDIDVLILGRGGGSMEDLWAFNEEIVARQIAASRIPVISAVGHEIDLTISDMVADKRALTPSEAGELVVPIKNELTLSLERSGKRLIGSLRNQVRLVRSKLDAIRDSYIFQQPFDRIREYQQRLDELHPRLEAVLKRIIETAHKRLEQIGARMDSLSPLKVLERGYSITKRERDNRLLRSIRQIKSGEKIITRLSDGKFTSQVETTDPPAGR